jgi:hypothetical protein
LRVVKEVPVRDARLEVRLVFRRREGRAVVVEVPGQLLARVVAVIEDGVLVAGQHLVVGARLAGAVATSPVGDGERLLAERAHQVREQHGARETVEAMAMRCYDELHDVGKCSTV